MLKYSGDKNTIHHYRLKGKKCKTLPHLPLSRLGGLVENKMRFENGIWVE